LTAVKLEQLQETMRHAIDDLQLVGRPGLLQRRGKCAGFAADETIGLPSRSKHGGSDAGRGANSGLINGSDIAAEPI
jgi:hypothetical protein